MTNRQDMLDKGIIHGLGGKTVKEIRMRVIHILCRHPLMFSVCLAALKAEGALRMGM